MTLHLNILGFRCYTKVLPWGFLCLNITKRCRFVLVLFLKIINVPDMHVSPCSRAAAGLWSPLQASWGFLGQQAHRCWRWTQVFQTAEPGYLWRRGNSLNGSVCYSFWGHCVPKCGEAFHLTLNLGSVRVQVGFTGRTTSIQWSHWPYCTWGF